MSSSDRRLSPPPRSDRRLSPPPRSDRRLSPPPRSNRRLSPSSPRWHPRRSSRSPPRSARRPPRTPSGSAHRNHPRSAPQPSRSRSPADTSNARRKLFKDELGSPSQPSVSARSTHLRVKDLTSAEQFIFIDHQEGLLLQTDLSTQVAEERFFICPRDPKIRSKIVYLYKFGEVNMQMEERDLIPWSEGLEVVGYYNSRLCFLHPTGFVRIYNVDTQHLEAKVDIPYHKKGNVYGFAECSADTSFKLILPEATTSDFWSLDFSKREWTKESCQFGPILEYKSHAVLVPNHKVLFWIGKVAVKKTKGSKGAKTMWVTVGCVIDGEEHENRYFKVDLPEGLQSSDMIIGPGSLDDCLGYHRSKGVLKVYLLSKCVNKKWNWHRITNVNIGLGNKSSYIPVSFFKTTTEDETYICFLKDQREIEGFRSIACGEWFAKNLFRMDFQCSIVSIGPRRFLMEESDEPEDGNQKKSQTKQKGLKDKRKKQT